MDLRDRFWPAYLARLDSLAREGLLARSAPTTCCDGHPYYWDPSKVQQRLVGFMGPAEWPNPETDALTNARIIEYVEAFYELVADPVERWEHEHCGETHATRFDVTDGRYKYTVVVNDLFRRFAPGFQMRSGRVSVATDSLFAPVVPSDFRHVRDERVKDLIARAVADFRSSDPTSRWTAIRHLADAWENVKTWYVRDNKRDSVQALVDRMTPDQRVAEHMNAILREVTTTSNAMGIRHTEIDKPDVRLDSDLMDFLFYMYLNVLRFALAKDTAS